MRKSEGIPGTEANASERTLQEAPALKAYSVQAEDCGCIRFAKSNVVARRQGANELDVEFEYVQSCRRAPEFDHLAPGPVSNLELFNAGWQFFCDQCELRFAESVENGVFLCDECAQPDDGAGNGTASTLQTDDDASGRPS